MSEGSVEKALAARPTSTVPPRHGGWTQTHIRRFDHVGITVADLDRAIDIFVDLGLEVEGRAFVEGEFLDTVSFEVVDIEGAVALAAERGYGLVGGIGTYEDQWEMAYVRGRGIIVSLAERIG